MNKKILTLSLVAVAAITASVATAFALRKGVQEFNTFVAAENQYEHTFYKQHFTPGTFDHSYDVILPFSLSKQTAGNSTLSTIDYDSSTWVGTYAYVDNEDDINTSKEDEIFSITRSNTSLAYAVSIGFRICPDASFSIDSSYVSYTVGGESKTAKFTYWYDDSDGYKIYYASPSVYGDQGTVFSLKYIYITYYC